MIRPITVPNVPWILSLVALALVALAAGGCAPDTGDEEGVVLWHSMPGDMKAVLESIADRFNQGRATNKIILRYQGEYGQLKSKIAMALKAGSPPHMAQMYEAWTSYFNAEKGREAILPLDPYVRRDARQVDLPDVYEAFVRDNTFGGKLYSFPFNKSFPGLFFNKELFAKAGLDPEKPPRTWAEFAEYGRKLTRDSNGDGRIDTWGWGFNVDPWIFECMVLQNGGELAHDDSRIVSPNGPPMVAAVEFLLDATSGPRPYACRSNGREFQNDFVAQRVAMIVTTCVSKSFMIDQIGFRWGLAPIPQGKRRMSVMAGTNIGIFAATPPDKREVAWEFVKFFASTDVTAFWAIRTGYVPVRRSAVASREFQEYLKIDPTPMAAIEQLEYATFEPRAPAWVDVRDRLYQALLRSVLGKGTPGQNLDWAASEVARIRGVGPVAPVARAGDPPGDAPGRR